MGFNPSEYQLKIFDFLENGDGNLIVNAVAGSGKCVAADTMVAINGSLMTAKSIFETYRTTLSTLDADGGLFCAPLSDLYVDSFDEITGRFTRSRVVALYREHHRGIMLRVTLDDGKQIRITPAHKLYDGYQWTNRFHENNIAAIPQTLSEGTQEFDPLLAEFLGWLIAEGYDHKKSLYSFTMRDYDNVAHIRDLVDWIEIRYGIVERSKKIVRSKNRNVYVMRFMNAELATLLTTIGYKANTLSKDKEIPPALMAADNKAIKAFLRAYFDGEGSVHQTRGTIEVTSASLMLIQQVSYLLQRLGVWARFSTVRKAATNGLNIKREYYRLVIGSLSARQFAKEIGFSLFEKQAKLDAAIQKKSNPNCELLPSVTPLSNLKKMGLGHHILGLPDPLYFDTKRLSRDTYTQRVRPMLDKLMHRTTIAANQFRQSIAIDQDIVKAIALSQAELDHVYDAALEYPKISKIEVEPYDGYVYDFTVENTHNFVANGILCHNTTTIEKAVQRLMAKSTKSIALIAFNRTIKAELLRRLGDKLSDKEIKTVHGLGWAAINYAMRRKPIVTQTKYRDLAKKWWEEANLLGTIPEPVLEAIADSRDTDLQKTLLYDIEGLHRFIRYDLINTQDTSAIRDLCHARDFYPLFFDTTLDGVNYLFKKGWEEFERNSTVDFTDLVYYPASRPDMRPLTFDLIFVDEAQDLSKMALELILKCQKRGGRLTFIGDSRQAIYAFAGADAKSWDNIIDRVKPTQLPLSKNYRCPTTVIDLAKRLVPQIEAHDGAETGAVRYMAEPLGIDEIMRDQANVLILGRLNAPLIGLAIRFIQKRVAAKVKGRDIGKELIAVLEAIAKQSGFIYDALPVLLQDYLKRQVDFLESQGASEMAIQAINDKIEALQTCYTDFGCSDLAALIREIDALFEDHLTPLEFLDKFPTLLGKFRYKNQRIIGVRGDNRRVVLLLEDSSGVELAGDSLKEELIQREIVWLSTVHKAKGLEEERIYIVNPEQIPLKFKGQSPAQYQQELNLAYVAITRAKKSLTIMGRPNKDGDKLQFFSIDLLNDTTIGNPASRIDEDLQALDKKHGVMDEGIVDFLKSAPAESIVAFIEERLKE